jgi:hypothetical protein
MASIKGRAEPAYSIVVRLGGVSATAKLLNLNQSSVSRWLTHTGTAGLIPQKYWVKILGFAKRHKISITIDDLAGLAR